jgi:hypothetical protein
MKTEIARMIPVMNRRRKIRLSKRRCMNHRATMANLRIIRTISAPVATGRGTKSM